MFAFVTVCLFGLLNYGRGRKFFHLAENTQWGRIFASFCMAILAAMHLQQLVPFFLLWPCLFLWMVPGWDFTIFHSVVKKPYIEFKPADWLAGKLYKSEKPATWIRQQLWGGALMAVRQALILPALFVYCWFLESAWALLWGLMFIPMGYSYVAGFYIQRRLGLQQYRGVPISEVLCGVCAGAMLMGGVVF